MTSSMAYRAPDNVQSVAVVGAGLIGASWAAYFLSRGLAVHATDPAVGAEGRLRESLRAAWPALERLGLPPGADRSRLAFFETLEEAVRRMRAAPGPDSWVQALFQIEAIARAARSVGDWEFAGQMARQLIEHDPSYAGSHYAMALVAEHDEDAAAARASFALAVKHWAKADPDLPELAEGRVYRVWLLRPSEEPIAIASFRPQPNGSASTVVDVPREVGDSFRLGVTDEPEGAPPMPPTEPWLTSDVVEDVVE